MQRAGLSEVLEHVACYLDIHAELTGEGDRRFADRGFAIKELMNAPLVVSAGSTPEQGSLREEAAKSALGDSLAPRQSQPALSFGLGSNRAIAEGRGHAG